MVAEDCWLKTETPESLGIEMSTDCPDCTFYSRINVKECVNKYSDSDYVVETIPRKTWQESYDYAKSKDAMLPSLIQAREIVYDPRNNHNPCTETFTGKGLDYRGCQDKTRNGKTCQNWFLQTPH